MLRERRRKDGKKLIIAITKGRAKKKGEEKMEKARVKVAFTKPMVLFSAETGEAVEISFREGENAELTAKEIFDCMSKDPSSVMPMNPTALSLSDDEKQALDKLFSFFKEAALNLADISTAKNCLEILSSPFGFLHPRRAEAVETLKQATRIPELKEFVIRLIEGSKEMLKGALVSGDGETKEVARQLLDMF